MKRLFFSLALVVLGSCTYNNMKPVEQIHYFSQVRTIIHNNCMHCHSESGAWYGHPIAFDKDSGIVVNSGLIKYEVQNKIMPKGGSLSQDDIDTIIKWFDAGGQAND